MPACPNHRSRIDHLYPAHHPNPTCTRRRAGQETEARREWSHLAAGGWRTRRNWGVTWVRCQQRSHNCNCRSSWRHRLCHPKGFLNGQRMGNTIMMKLHLYCKCIDTKRGNSCLERLWKTLCDFHSRRGRCGLDCPSLHHPCRGRHQWDPWSCLDAPVNSEISSQRWYKYKDPIKSHECSV